MARIRTLKPEFWKHEELSALPEPTHLLAAALLNYADDYGYFNANPALVKAECSPLREPSVSVRDSLASLSRVGYVSLGTGSDGKRYGRILKFDMHQKVDHKGKSKFEHISITWDSCAESSRESRESLAPEVGSRNREIGKGEASARSPAGSMPPPMVHAEHSEELKLSPVFIELPLNTGKPQQVREALVAELGKLYPAVDVAQQLRAMRGWLDANPRKRKTRAGVLRFVNGWLAKEQDRGSSVRSNGQSAPAPVSPEARAASDLKNRVNLAWGEVQTSLRLSVDLGGCDAATTREAVERIGGLDTLRRLPRRELTEKGAAFARAFTELARAT